MLKSMDKLGLVIWPIYDYRPKNINGRWSVDIVLITKLGTSYFSACKLCRKTGGHVLTPHFGMVKNIIKKASNGKVLKVRKFRIVERRNFDIWAIAIQSHL